MNSIVCAIGECGLDGCVYPEIVSQKYVLLSALFILFFGVVLGMYITERKYRKVEKKNAKK